MLQIYSVTDQEISLLGTVNVHGEAIIKEKWNDVGTISFSTPTNYFSYKWLKPNNMVVWNSSHAFIINSVTMNKNESLIYVAGVSLEALLAWRYCLGSYEFLGRANLNGRPKGFYDIFSLVGQSFGMSFGTQEDFLTPTERTVFKYGPYKRTACWKFPMIIAEGESDLGVKIVPVTTAGKTVLKALQEFCVGAGEDLRFQIYFDVNQMKFVFYLSHTKLDSTVIASDSGSVTDISYTESYENVVNMLQFSPKVNYGNAAANSEMRNIIWRSMYDPIDDNGNVFFQNQWRIIRGPMVRCGWADIENSREQIVGPNYFQNGDFYVQEEPKLVYDQMNLMTDGFNDKYKFYSCTVHDLEVPPGDRIKVIDPDFDVNAEMNVNEIEYHIDSNDKWFSLTDLSASL